MAKILQELKQKKQSVKTFYEGRIHIAYIFFDNDVSTLYKHANLNGIKENYDKTINKFSQLFKIGEISSVQVSHVKDNVLMLEVMGKLASDEVKGILNGPNRQTYDLLSQKIGQIKSVNGFDYNNQVTCQGKKQYNK